jgi:hypothetical protein
MATAVALRRNTLRVKMMVSGLCALTLLVTLVWVAGTWDGSPPIILFILLAAALGRGVQVSTRKAESLAEPILNPLGDILWELLVAMLFGAVIYLMFQGNILSGELFPSFRSATQRYDNMLEYMQRVKPSTNADTAKALFWAFIAGYSTRFVPGLLRAKGGDDADESTKAPCSET